MPVADQDSALHRAALTLHALPTRDRARVLNRLDPAWHAPLRGLLRELSDLGIPEGRAWLDLSSSGQGNEKSSALTSSLGMLRPEQALQLLRTQSTATAALVLQLDDWPWKVEVMARWPAHLKGELRDQLASAVDVAPALREAVLRRASEQAKAWAASRGPVPVSGSGGTKRSWTHALASIFMLT